MTKFKLLSLLTAAAMTASLVVPFSVVSADDAASAKKVDVTVDLGITTSPAELNGQKPVYDLIQLAMDVAPDDADDIASSDVIGVQFTVTVNDALSSTSYFDISSGTPVDSYKTAEARFALIRLYNGWTQFDVVDNSQDLGGTSNVDNHQYLNIAGKYDSYYGQPNIIKAEINYTDKTVTINASGSGDRRNVEPPYTLTGFPTTEKGKINFGIFPGNSTDDLTISNVRLTYQKTVDSDEPIVVPDGEGIYEFPANSGNVKNGSNPKTNESTYTFVDGVNAKLKALFANSEDDSKVDDRFVAYYRDYVGGTDTRGTHPTLKFTANAGKYKLFYLGYKNDNGITATIDGVGELSVAAGDGIDLATTDTNSDKPTLRLYELGEFELASDAMNKDIVFDTSGNWLPDFAAAVIVGTKELTDEEDESKGISKNATEVEDVTDYNGPYSSIWSAEFSDLDGTYTVTASAKLATGETKDSDKQTINTELTNANITIAVVVNKAISEIKELTVTLK